MRMRHDVCIHWWSLLCCFCTAVLNLVLVFMCGQLVYVAWPCPRDVYGLPCRYYVPV